MAHLSDLVVFEGLSNSGKSTLIDNILNKDAVTVYGKSEKHPLGKTLIKWTPFNSNDMVALESYFQSILDAGTYTCHQEYFEKLYEELSLYKENMAVYLYKSKGYTEDVYEKYTQDQIKNLEVSENGIIECVLSSVYIMNNVSNQLRVLIDLITCIDDESDFVIVADRHVASTFGYLPLDLQNIYRSYRDGKLKFNKYHEAHVQEVIGLKFIRAVNDALTRFPAHVNPILFVLKTPLEVRKEWSGNSTTNSSSDEYYDKLSNDESIGAGIALCTENAIKKYEQCHWDVKVIETLDLDERIQEVKEYAKFMSL